MLARQYRRWLVSAAIIFIGLMSTMLLGRDPGGRPTGYMAQVAEAFWQYPDYALLLIAQAAGMALVIAGVLTLIAAILIPALLTFVETMPLIVFVLMAIRTTIHELQISHAIELILSLVFLYLIIGFYCCWRPWRNLGARDMRQGISFETSALPERVFSFLVPSETTIDKYLRPGSRIFPTAGAPTQGFTLATPWRLGWLFSLQEIRLEAFAPPHGASWTQLTISQGPKAVYPPTGSQSVIIEPTAAGSKVSINTVMKHVPLSYQVYWFLMMNNRDVAASYKARLEGRRDWSIYGRTTLPTSPVKMSEVE